jgi:hypothetical protein
LRPSLVLRETGSPLKLSGLSRANLVAAFSINHQPRGLVGAVV